MKDNLGIDQAIERVVDSSFVRNSGLKREFVETILSHYNDAIVSTLLDSGKVELSNGMTISVVHLRDRVHVLRGISYKSNRRYKLKITMDERVYQKIEDHYNQLREDIL